MSQEGAVLARAVEEVGDVPAPHQAGGTGGASPGPPRRRWPGGRWDDLLVRVLAPGPPWALSPLSRYALACAIVVAATVLRWALTPYLGTVAPYNAASVAVVTATVLLGIGPGVMSVVLADVAVEVFITGSLRTVPEGVVLTRLAISASIGVFVCCLLHAIRIALVKARESEARLGALLEASFEGIGESEHGRIVACNAQLARMLGYSVRELKGMEIASLIAPEDRERVAANIRANRASVVEHAMIRKDGTRIIVEAHGRPISPDGSRRHTAVRDITERKRHEQALRESEERFRLLVEGVSDYAIFMLDARGRVATWNVGAERIKGYTAGEIVGEHFSRFYLPEDIAAGKPQRELEIAAERGVFAEESWRVRKDGTRFWASVTITAMRNPAGELRGFTKVTQDLTERKASEESLRRGQQRLDMALAAGGMGTWVWEPSTGRVECDARHRELWGFEPAAACVYAEAIRERILPEDLPRVWQSDPELLAAGHMASEFRIRLPDGEVRWLAAYAGMIRDERGAVTHLVGVNYDITERKAAEEALQRLNSELEKRVAERTGEVAAERQRFFDVLETLPVIISLLRADHRIVFGNRAYRDALGANKGRLCYEAQFGRKEPCVECQAFRPLETGKPHRWEWTLPNGRTFDIYNFPFIDADGTAMILEMDLDITTQRRAEVALFQNMLDGFARCRMICDEGGRPVDFVYLQVNDAFERLTGLKDVVGKKVSEVIPGIREAHPEVFELYQRVASTGRPEKLEMEFTPLGMSLALSAYSPERGEFVAIFDNITNRKRTEEALRESEQRFRRLIQLVPIPVGLVNCSGQSVYFNESFTQVFGYTQADLPTLDDWWRLAYPDAKYRRRVIENWQAKIHRSAESRTPTQPEEFNVTCKDGSVRVVVISGLVIDDCTLATFIDITERKRAEEALRESEQRLKFVLETCHIGAWDMDIADQTTIRSAEHDRIYGYETPLPQWTYEMFLAHVLPEDRARVDATYQQAVSKRTSWDFEFRIRRADGQVRWIWATGSQKPDPSGKFGRVAGIVLDITDRKKAEAALRDSEQRLARAQEIAHLGSWELDLVHDRLTWSDEVYRIFGVSPQEFAATYEAFLERVHPDDRAAVDEAYSGSLREGRDSYEIEHRVVRHATGEVRWVQERCQHVRDSAGRIVGSVGMVHDITERKRAEEELKDAKLSAEAAREAAETANQAKDHFLSVLSHELRTPLTPVLITASALESDDGVSDWIRDDMGLVRRSVELEVKLIDDLLDINRIMRGKLALRLEEMDAHVKILSAVELCQKDAEAKKIDMAADLSAGCSHLKADGGRLQQIVWNLVKNSIKFTPASGRVRIRTSNPVETVLRIEVEDTGIGMPAEAIPRLFKAFEQADEHITRQFGGLGLGLAICRALVEMHGGTISADSAGPGNGATFTVDLPVAPPRDVPGSPQAAAGLATARGVRILYVEDHAATASIMQKMLTRGGHEVIPASNVGEAIRAAKEHAFDLLVCDLGLPDGSGLDVIRELRARNPQMKGIALSGFGMDANIERSRAAGFLEHLTKPVKMAALLQAIARAAETE